MITVTAIYHPMSKASLVYSRTLEQLAQGIGSECAFNFPDKATNMDLLYPRFGHFPFVNIKQGKNVLSSILCLNLYETLFLLEQNALTKPLLTKAESISDILFRFRVVKCTLTVHDPWEAYNLDHMEETKIDNPNYISVSIRELFDEGEEMCTREMFLANYLTYKHLALRFTVRPGVNYGVEWLCYTTETGLLPDKWLSIKPSFPSPEDVHSTYAVAVLIDDRLDPSCKSKSGMTLARIAGLNRVCVTAKKTLILAVLKEHEVITYNQGSNLSLIKWVKVNKWSPQQQPLEGEDLASVYNPRLFRDQRQDPDILAQQGCTRLDQMLKEIEAAEKEEKTKDVDLCAKLDDSLNIDEQ